jgi:hypothetical protein
MDKIAQLKKLLADADAIIKDLNADPHFSKCPFLAPIRSGLVNGAIARIEHLESWLGANPVPAAPGAPGTN